MVGVAPLQNLLYMSLPFWRYLSIVKGRQLAGFLGFFT